MFNFANIRTAFGAPAAPGINIVDEAAEGRITLIDVRGHDEVAQSGKAKGAIHIPLMMLQYHADPRHPEFNGELSADRPIGVYCASGARSSMAAQVLRQLGYSDVTNVGGLGDWMRAGGELER